MRHALAELLARMSPKTSALLPPFEEWTCCLCASGEVCTFGVIGTSPFTARRFAGSQYVAFFLCHPHAKTPRPEIEDRISLAFEGLPPDGGFSVYVPPARPRPI